MVFTLGRGFVFWASFGTHIRSLRYRVLVGNAADTASLAARFLFGKLLRVATTFGFGEKRCRKNLPLDGTATCTTSVAKRTLNSTSTRW